MGTCTIKPEVCIRLTVAVVALGNAAEHFELEADVGCKVVGDETEEAALH